MRTDMAVTVFRLLAAVKFDKLQGSEKIDALKNFQKFKKATADFEDMLKSAQEKFKGEPNAQELIDKAMAEDAAKECEIDVKPMTEEAFDRLMQGSDWNFAQADAMYGVLVKEQSNGVD